VKSGNPWLQGQYGDVISDKNYIPQVDAALSHRGRRYFAIRSNILQSRRTPVESLLRGMSASTEGFH
jgi:hypothetical protein